MTYPPLRFAIVGCGSIAATHADVLHSFPEATLSACCDSVPARAEAFAARFGARALPLDTLLADPDVDAVAVCTPSGLHAEIGIRALRAGKHVLVEKPMDVTLAACDLLMQAAEDAGRTLSVIAQHRYDAASVHVKQAMTEHALGALVYAEARVPWYRTQEYYDSGDWRGTWELDGGGALMNQGVHTADLLRWICGPVQSVYAQARTLAHADIEVEDIASAVLTFTGGALGTLTASTALYPGFAASLGVHGTKGSALISGDTLALFSVRGQPTLAGQAANAHALQVAQGGTKAATEGKAQPQEQSQEPSAASDPAALWGDAHRAQYADFVRCCRTGQAPVADAQGARAAVELVLAVYQSARTGLPVLL